MRVHSEILRLQQQEHLGRTPHELLGSIKGLMAYGTVKTNKMYPYNHLCLSTDELWVNESDTAKQGLRNMGLQTVVMADVYQSLVSAQGLVPAAVLSYRRNQQPGAIHEGAIICQPWSIVTLFAKPRPQVTLGGKAWEYLLIEL